MNDAAVGNTIEKKGMDWKWCTYFYSLGDNEKYNSIFTSFWLFSQKSFAACCGALCDANIMNCRV